MLNNIVDILYGFIIGNNIFRPSCFMVLSFECGGMVIKQCPLELAICPLTSIIKINGKWTLKKFTYTIKRSQFDLGRNQMNPGYESICY